MYFLPHEVFPLKNGASIHILEPKSKLPYKGERDNEAGSSVIRD